MFVLVLNRPKSLKFVVFLAKYGGVMSEALPFLVEMYCSLLLGRVPMFNSSSQVGELARATSLKVM